MERTLSALSVGGLERCRLLVWIGLKKTGEANKERGG